RGGTTTFNVAVDSTAHLAYQWSFNGTNLPGATNSVLTLMNVRFDQAGSYSVIVSNSFGGGISDSATLSVLNFVLWNGFNYPVPLNDLTNVLAIAAGWSHVIVLKPDNTIVIWGDNGNGQLNVPYALTNVRALAANSIQSIVLKNDGTVD